MIIVREYHTISPALPIILMSSWTSVTYLRNVAVQLHIELPRAAIVTFCRSKLPRPVKHTNLSLLHVSIITISFRLRAVDYNVARVLDV